MEKEERFIISGIWSKSRWSNCLIVGKNLPTRRIARSFLKNKARDIPFGFEGNEEKASFPFIDRRRDGRGKGRDWQRR